MPRTLDKLLLNSSPPISRRPAVLTEPLRALAGNLYDELLQMLFARNGFYAFERALHVFPACATHSEIGLREWNDDALWRNKYDGHTAHCLFFAEDVFGGQFCIRRNAVHTFDPETGDVDYFADDLEGWAGAVLMDFQVLTGFPIAHDWQAAFGAIPPGKRLLPKIPFVAGGDYTLNNLHLADAIEGMILRANIANQIRGLEDGSKIRLKITD